MKSFELSNESVDERFCPKCGKGLRIADCGVRLKWGLVKELSCRECQVPSYTSGQVFLGLGLALGFIGLLMTEYLLILGIGMMLFSLVRYQQQSRAALKSASRSGASV
ncbi:MAG: hypothetical protein K0Q55_3440 [Verrucomicrobia bacterium]|jgi:ribosomal protein S27AE|nr:hypothetical protein [Verrucomicrobiota bacterium]